jgi:type II restriction enzyme
MKGNIGDWSEVYVFLKLLSECKLNAADSNLNAIPNVYYPIIKIIREEVTKVNSKKVLTQREFSINGDIKIIDGSTNAHLLTIPIADFFQKSKELLDDLKIAKGLSFSFPAIETFLNSIDVKSLKAKSSNKADIVF